MESLSKWVSGYSQAWVLSNILFTPTHRRAAAGANIVQARIGWRASRRWAGLAIGTWGDLFVSLTAAGAKIIQA